VKFTDIRMNQPFAFYSACALTNVIYNLDISHLIEDLIGDDWSDSAKLSSCTLDRVETSEHSPFHHPWHLLQIVSKRLVMVCHERQNI